MREPFGRSFAPVRLSGDDCFFAKSCCTTSVVRYSPYILCIDVCVFGKSGGVDALQYYFLELEIGAGQEQVVVSRDVCFGCALWVAFPFFALPSTRRTCGAPERPF